MPFTKDYSIIWVNVLLEMYKLFCEPPTLMDNWNNAFDPYSYIAEISPNLVAIAILRIFNLYT